MDLSYPIGKYEHKASLSPAERENAIAQIAATPKRLRDAVAGLSHQQFDTPYRPGGWTVRQVDLRDSRDTPVEISLTLLEALHHRWDVLLRSLRSGDFARLLRHPQQGTMTLDDMVGSYAWHGRHHVAHITSLRDREGWK